MQSNTYWVVVIPNLNRDRKIVRTMTAYDATEAAGAVLCALGGAPVDCIEVSQLGRGRKVMSKVAFYSCLYGMTQGFLYVDRLTLGSSRLKGEE